MKISVLVELGREADIVFGRQSVATGVVDEAESSEAPSDGASQGR
jgi:hypothetical protein